MFATSDGNCLPCKSPCATCMNETKCLSCEENKSFHENNCLSSCPLNYYSSESKCKTCHPSCETCTGPDKFNCITCEEGFEYSNKECVSKCPDGTYFDKKIKECNLCNVNYCSSCIRTPNMCTKCLNPLALDAQTFTCKQCCSRSIHGKVTLSCCNCPTKFAGKCSNVSSISNTNNLSGMVNDMLTPIQNTSDSIIFAVSILLIIASIGLIVFSIFVFRVSCRKIKSYQTVEYQPLSNSDTKLSFH